MKMLKKYSIFIILLLTFSVIFVGCGSKDLTKGKTGQEILEAAYTKIQEVKNYDMNIQMDMKMEVPGQGPMDMHMQGTATVHQQPVLMKLVMDMEANGETNKFEQYMEQKEEGIVVYQHLDNKWNKLVLDDPALVKMMNMDPSKNLTLYLENLEKATILAEEQIGEKDTVKLEMVVSSKMYDEILSQMPGANIAGNMPLDTKILGQIGDITGTIWVDKATLNIVKTSMDMTENLKNLGNALKESGNIPAEVAEVFGNMEVSMEYEITNQNTAQEITIPEEAKNAEEIKLPNN